MTFKLFVIPTHIRRTCLYRCCTKCGNVIDDAGFSNDVQFQKDGAGDSSVVGQFVSETGVVRGIGRVAGGRVYGYQVSREEKLHGFAAAHQQ